MNRSRTRQFNQFRNAPANNASVRSQANQTYSSKMSQSTVSEACVNCVNQIMADRHRKAQKQLKQKQKLQFKKNFEVMNSMIDTQNRYRQVLKKDALNHNSRMIEQQKVSKMLQKQQDLKYAEEVQKNMLQAEKNVKNQIVAQKQKQNQYYQQIHDQYLNQLEKKDRQRLHKQPEEDKHQGLPLYNQNLAEQKQKYKKELERQMEQKKKKQNQQRIRNQIRQKQLMQQSKKQADKYHADNYQALKMSKEEVFGGLKNLQHQKKRKAEEDRKRKQEDRLKEIKQQNEYRSKAIKFKMEEMQKYVDGLKNQLLQKQQKLKMSRMADSKFVEKYPKSTEEISAENQIKKKCRSCKKDYPQEFMSPVPKKA